MGLRSVRTHVGRPPGQETGNPLVLACTIVKLGPTRLIATLEDVSERVAQERRLKQPDAWFASFVTYGHAVGDLVLKAVARACMDVLRPSDTFARLGGEEFTAFLP